MPTPRSITRDAARYSALIFREWQALVTGGALVAGLFFIERVAGVAVARGIPQAIAVLALLAASFRVWRAERDGRLASEERLREHDEAARSEDGLALEVSDDEFWLLGRVAK